MVGGLALLSHYGASSQWAQLLKRGQFLNPEKSKNCLYPTSSNKAPIKICWKQIRRVVWYWCHRPHWDGLLQAVVPAVGLAVWLSSTRLLLTAPMQSWGLLHALQWKQIGGWYLRMTWGQEVYYALLYSEPASALGLPTVFSLWGNPRRARCWHMSTLPEGYILQCKVTSVSSSGSPSFIHCVWSVVRWLKVYQDINYLYPGQYSQTIYWSLIRW